MLLGSARCANSLFHDMNGVGVLIAKRFASSNIVTLSTRGSESMEN
jgi:hypothetical protein